MTYWQRLAWALVDPDALADPYGWFCKHTYVGSRGIGEIPSHYVGC